MPLQRIQRSEIWLVDLGYLGKVRPVLVVSIPFLDHERTLCLVVPHTTTLKGTQFEVSLEHPALKEGAFDVQQTAAVQASKFVRRLGALNLEQMGLVEQAGAKGLGLKLAPSGVH